MKERKDLAQAVYSWREFRELRTVESVFQRLSLHQGPPNHGPILTQQAGDSHYTKETMG